MHLQVQHQLKYSYSQPVILEPHLLYLYPKQSPFVALGSYAISVSPQPSKTIVNTDIEGNVCHLAFFKGYVETLSISTMFNVTTSLKNPFDFFVYPFENQRIPFRYDAQIQKMLHLYLIREGVTTLIDQYARQIASEVHWDALHFFIHLNNIINKFTYEIREEGNAYSPEKVLLSRKGSCRDYVSLYMAICRTLGIAARFVSGYCLGDPLSIHYLHAWVEVFIPGAGWRGYDPTENCMVNDSYIPLASSIYSSSVAPVSGMFRGNAQANLTTQINIQAI
jgi:transglutaminase-like putative cysteine protease